MHLLILGTRGVPAKHGGFETFAQDLSLYLTARNHKVTVYCQIQAGNKIGEDDWNGVRRVLIPAAAGPLGTMVFDWVSTRHASRENGIALTLGYNTGVFSLTYRLKRILNVMNMDGIEWKRRKWSIAQRGWLRLNERVGAVAANHLIADHPEIARHLSKLVSSDKISMIPYGATPILSAATQLIERYGLKAQRYHIVIARPEPENSILEIVQAYSRRHRGKPLVLLGNYSRKANQYQRSIIDAAGPEVMFIGAVYDREIVGALRFHARTYIHGHTIGGTNPSLVEAMAAGCAVIAHDNPYNRWVAGPNARYFDSLDSLDVVLRNLEKEPGLLAVMKEGSRERHERYFTHEKVLGAYECLLRDLSIQRTLMAKQRDRGSGYPRRNQQLTQSSKNRDRIVQPPVPDEMQNGITKRTEARSAVVELE